MIYHVQTLYLHFSRYPKAEFFNCLLLNRIYPRILTLLLLTVTDRHWPQKRPPPLFLGVTLRQETGPRKNFESTCISKFHEGTKFNQGLFGLAEIVKELHKQQPHPVRVGPLKRASSSSLRSGTYISLC